MALQNQYGLGYSPLSIKHVQDYAFKEESVANKEVGLYGIVSDDDLRIMSAQYVARTKYQMDTFVNRLISDNTIGKVWKLTMDDMLVRTIQDDTTNWLEDAVPSDVQIDYGTKRIRGLRFNVDLDWIAKTRSALKYNGSINVRIGMTVRIGTFSVHRIIEDTIDGINSTAYAMDYTGLERAVGDLYVVFDEFTIIPEVTFDYDENVLALYDVLVCAIPIIE